MVAKFQLLALASSAAIAFAAPVPTKTQPEHTFPTSPATNYFIKLFESWGWKRDVDHKDVFPPFYGIPPWHTAPAKPTATKPASNEKRDDGNQPMLPAPISQPFFPPGLSPYPPGMSPIKARSIEQTSVEKRDEDSDDVVMPPLSLLCKYRALPGCPSSKRDIDPSSLPPGISEDLIKTIIEATGDDDHDGVLNAQESQVGDGAAE